MPDQYNSPVSLLIHPLNGEDSRENFSDLQMAYLRMIEIMDQHGGEWDEHSLDNIAYDLDSIQESGNNQEYVCIACDDLQLCINYIV